MSLEEARKQKNQPQHKDGNPLEGILERLREGLDELLNGLKPAQPQPVPIPIPIEYPRRR